MINEGLMWFGDRSQSYLTYSITRYTGVIYDGGELQIIRDDTISFLYARNVLRGRFRMSENLHCAGFSSTSFIYVHDILGYNHD